MRSQTFDRTIFTSKYHNNVSVDLGSLYASLSLRCWHEIFLEYEFQSASTSPSETERMFDPVLLVVVTLKKTENDPVEFRQKHQQ